jgi:hypothetical protein
LSLTPTKGNENTTGQSLPHSEVILAEKRQNAYNKSQLSPHTHTSSESKFILTLPAFGSERIEVCLKVVDTHYEMLLPLRIKLT